MHHSLEEPVSTGSSCICGLCSIANTFNTHFSIGQENLQKSLGMTAAYPKSLQLMVLNAVTSAENEQDTVWINTCVLTGFSNCCSEGSQGETRLHYGPDQCEEQLTSIYHLNLSTVW